MHTTTMACHVVEHASRYTGTCCLNLPALTLSGDYASINYMYVIAYPFSLQIHVHANVFFNVSERSLPDYVRTFFSF